ncbi:oligosaccharide flippase family protein [Nocardioides sp. W3-2-3]|nr:oligosaccharide flippase family protein [Nocardioides convexus]
MQSLVVLALFWVLRRPVLPGWSATDARDLLAFGGSLAASGLLTLVVLNVDYLLVAHRLGTADVGVYSMAFRIAYMPYLLIAMVVGARSSRTCAGCAVPPSGRRSPTPRSGCTCSSSRSTPG